jgi:hypothetical protein
MLNVKYIIFDKEISSPDLQLIYSGNNNFVYLNKNALPRAYFVDTISKKSAMEIINLVKNTQFDPRYIAFVEEDLNGIETPDSTAYVRIENFGDEHVELNVKATGNNFLFLGDTYMTGTADYKLFKFPIGWKAYIDGNETKIYKANHGFRGVVIPQGEHKVEFIYSPISFTVSKYLSLTFSSLVMLGLVVTILLRFRKNKNIAKSES